MNTAADAREFIAAGNGWIVAKNLDKFVGLDHNEIAHAIIESGQGSYMGGAGKSVAC